MRADAGIVARDGDGGTAAASVGLGEAELLATSRYDRALEASPD
jgi:hypothetical protein